MLCGDHSSAARVKCVCASPCIDVQIWKCALCRGRFHTCMQSGSLEQPFLCENCQKWKEARLRLLREDSGGAKARARWIHPWEPLPLADRLLVGRVVESRAQSLLQLSTIEEIRELQDLAKLMCGRYVALERLGRKAELAGKLERRAGELVGNWQKEEVSAVAIQELEAACQSQGLILTQLPTLRQAVFQSEVINRIKALTHTSQRVPIAEAQAYFPVAISALGSDSKWVKYLSLAIDKAVQWKGEVEGRMGSTGQGSKLGLQEAGEMMRIGLKLTLRVRETLELLEERIAETERWEKVLDKTALPLPLELLPSFFPLLQLSIWTPKQAELASALALYQSWEAQMNAFLAGSEPLPLQTVHMLISQALSIRQYVSVCESTVKTMEAAYEEGLAWSLTAQTALLSPHPPAYMSHLLHQASSLRTTPPELPSVQSRAQINTKIAYALQHPCTEAYLRELQTQAKALYADSQYINSLEVHIDSMEEFIDKMRKLRENQGELEVYEALLGKMEALQLNLGEEREYMQDAVASIRWLKAAREASDLRELKDMIEAGLKIKYKLPALQATLTQILENYWTREWGNRDKSLSELIEIEDLQGNCSPDFFKSHLERVKAAVSVLDSVSEVSLSDPQTLIYAISTNMSTLQQERVLPPLHSPSISLFSQWANWSQSAFLALNGETKPSVQSLYTLNDQALSLSVPASAPAFSALVSALSLYEQWLSRFCAYQEGKRRYNAHIEAYFLLEKLKSDQRPGEGEVQELVRQAERLGCDCAQELGVLISDLEKAAFWVTRVEMVLEKGSLGDLLAAAKRSCHTTKEGTMHQSLEQAAQTYLSEISVTFPKHTPPLGTYFWHFRVLEVFQGAEKVPSVQWDSLLAQVPLLDPGLRDDFIIEKVSRQESLRRRLQQFSPIQANSMLQLVEMYAEFQACKVELFQESEVVALVRKAAQALEGFERLWSEGATEEEIDQVWNQLISVGIPVPDLEKQLTQARTKAKDVREAAKELLRKERKSSKELVLNVLKTAQSVPIRIAEVAQLQGLLASAEAALGEIRRTTESASLELVLQALERLEELSIRIEPEETHLREQLWKRKVNLALSSVSRPAVQILQEWQQESLGQGSQERSDLTALLTPRPVPVLKSEFCPNVEEIGDYIPPKRGKTLLTASSDPVRGAAVATIETALVEDYQVPGESAALLAPKLENCLFKQSYDYQQGLQNFLQTLDGLANFEEFWEKLMGEGIEWRQVLALTPVDLRRGKVLRRLFGCLPRVSLRVNMRKLEGANKETCSRLEGNKAQMDAPKHFLTDIINDFKVFKGMQQEPKKDCEPSVHPEPCDPPKRPATTPPPNPIKKHKSEPIPTSNAKSDQSNEYSLLDCLPASKTQSKGRMYDPNMSHLIWRGVVEYCGEAVKVHMYANEALQTGRKLPRNGEKVKISSKAKGNELEICLRKGAAAGLLSVCWVETCTGSRLVRDLQDRGSALVVKYEGCVMYLVVWSDSLQKVVDREKLLKLQNRGKLAAFLVHRPNPVPTPTPIPVLEAGETSISSDSDEDKDFRLIEAILVKLQSGQTLSADDLQQLKSILLRHPSPEVSQLVASINVQLCLPKDREDSVTDFLASQAKDANARLRYRTSA